MEKEEGMGAAAWATGAILVLMIFLMLTGCASNQQEAVLHAATIPGTDKRCVMGFCYEREREVDVEALKALAEYMKAQKELKDDAP